MPTFFMMLLGFGAPASVLHPRTIPNTTRVASDLIVGRAVCGETTWLLTDRPELISIAHATPNPVIKPLKGLQATDRAWGLACLADGSLWTHATSTTLVRLGPDATVKQRVSVGRPRMMLFGWQNRVLVTELPIGVGTPTFATTAIDGRDAHAWPGLTSRAAESPAGLLARNLANCGIASGASLPCWFADGRTAAVADGVKSISVTFPALWAGDVDREAPIWDLAFQGDEGFWLLVNTNAAARPHKAGGRL